MTRTGAERCGLEREGKHAEEEKEVCVGVRMSGEEENDEKR
jgi:hypothetical protein